MNSIFRSRTSSRIAATAAFTALVFLTSCKTSVTTYHYDNLRTGWNADEKKLKPSNVSSLKVLVLALDDVNDQVDTQPLIVPRVHIAGDHHDVVYLATENNNVYAIDADTDTKLLKVNLGTPVSWPIGCSNNGPTVGIDGTPVIDLVSRTMYVIAYVVDDASGNTPQYYLHALDLDTLTDKVAKKKITASHTLQDGSTFNFNATYQRQRPGLLLANGNVYAGFGSFCDWGGGNSRGWILGWQAGTLAPLAANDINDTQISEPHNMFLSSVWASGYGTAADPDGNLYFTTGNSDYSGTTYDGCTNIQESVVKLPSNLVRTCPTLPPPNPFLFTPANVAGLDIGDVDVGSAGVMALPLQSGSVPKLLVSNAKDGSMFLLNRDNLGGFTPTNAGVLGGVQSIGAGCWCGPTYFDDGSPHIVTSGGGWPSGGVATNSLQLWNLQTSPSPQLLKTATGAMPDTIQDTGFLTTVSSHDKHHAIIWAVSRPLTNSVTPNIWLYAFNGTPSGSTLPPLFQAVAGSWPNLGGNANIVPVVANGKVYVASYKELDIFGLGLPNGQDPGLRKMALAAEKIEFYKGPHEHQVSGTSRKVDGSHLTLETRDHKMVEVDASKAQGASMYAVVAVGNGVTVAGSYGAKGVLQAESVWRVKAAPATWPPDR